jgi:hypothetical protein
MHWNLTEYHTCARVIIFKTSENRKSDSLDDDTDGVGSAIK